MRRGPVGLTPALPLARLRAISADEKEFVMSIAKITEISASSSKSFEDAIQHGIARASKTLQGIEGAWIKEQKVVVKNNKITDYRVDMKVTFILKD